MNKVLKVYMPVVKGFLYCFAFIQIVLGVVYVFQNGITVPQFRDTEIYLQMSEQFVVDEYIGILYPLLVTGCIKILGAYYFVPIYLLQLIIGFLCVFQFVRAFTGRKWFAGLIALWINTIPIVIQMHLTVLPYSLVFSCFVMMLLKNVTASVQKRVLTYREWGVLLCSFTILCQLVRGYMVIGILFLVWALLLLLYTKKHKLLLMITVSAICTGITVSNLAIYYGTETEGYYGRIQKSVGSILLQRFSAPVLWEKYMIYMPEEITDSFAPTDLALYRRYPYKIQGEMGPVLETRYGKERADEIFGAIGRLGLEVATKENIKAFGEDVFSYAFPQVAFSSLRDGNIKGMTSWNYQQFTRISPVLSVYYFNVCQYMWMIGVALSLVGLFIYRCLRKIRFMHVLFPIIIIILGIGVSLSVGAAGSFDYRQALFPAACMYVPLCLMMALRRQNGAVYENRKA